MRQFFWGLLFPLAAFSLPSGGALKGGEASLAQDKNALHITSQSERTAIEWNKFSIAEHEQVHFHQPSKNSAVLNNVIGGDISHLMGSLESTLGKVYIVNPNGIIIGKDAIINVGGLVASTLKITNEDFFQGNDHFFGSSRARVVNLGQITAHSGDINVISYQIDNRGELLSPEGSVTLSAANEAWLQPNSNKKVLIKTTLESADSEDNGVSNSGVIRALQTELDADGNIYKFAINHSGSIEAPTLEEQNGRVFLRAENGCAKVTGSIEAPGGHVEVLADRVGIDETAFIDVSHEKQAGEILIGGDWRGENTPFRANHSYLGPDAALHANGIGSGNGGTVVLWGELSSRVFGEASARGGALGGNGGKIEVSRIPLIATKRLFADAPGGAKGMLLFDPPNITISTAASTATDVVPNGGSYEFEGTTVELNIQNSQITGFLNMPVDVVIDVAAGSSTAAGAGNITIEDEISWTSSGNLTLTADTEGTIQINNTIENNTSWDAELILNANHLIIGNSSHTTPGEIFLGTTTFNATGTSPTLEVYGSSGPFSHVFSHTFNVTGYPATTLQSGETVGKEAQVSFNIANLNLGSLTMTAQGGLVRLSGNAINLNMAGDIVMTSLSAGGRVEIEVAEVDIQGDGHNITLDSQSTNNVTILSRDSRLNGNITIGSTETRMGYITLNTSSTGQAYIKSGYGSVSIYGTRTSAVSSAEESSSHPPTLGAVRPGGGDAYIEAKDSLIFDAGLSSTVTASSRTILYTTSRGGNITIGNAASTDGDALISLGGSQEMIIEAGSEGTIQFYEGLEQTSTGALTLHAGSVLLGENDHSHTAPITVSTSTGALNVGFTAAGGEVGVYTGINGANGATTTLSSGAGLTIGKASGFTGVPGDVKVTSAPVTTTEADAKITAAGALAITAKNVEVTCDGEASKNTGDAYILQSGTGFDLTIMTESSGSVLVTTDAANPLNTGNAYIGQLGSTDKLEINAAGNVYVTNTGTSSLSSAYIGGLASSGGHIDITAAGEVTAELSGQGSMAIIQGKKVSVTTTGDAKDIKLINSGVNGNGEASIEALGTDLGDDVTLALTGNLVLQASGESDAYITSAQDVIVGSSGTHIGGYLQLDATDADARAYISAPSGDIAIYGTRTNLSQSGPSSNESSIHTLGAVTPGDGDAYIEASGNITFETGLVSTVTSGKRTIIHGTGSASNITIGDSNSSDTDPLIELGGGQELIIEAGATSGDITIYEGIERTSTGNLTLTAGEEGAIQITDALIEASANGGDITLNAQDIILGNVGHTAYGRIRCAIGAIALNATGTGTKTLQLYSGGSKSSYINTTSNVGSSITITGSPDTVIDSSGAGAYIESPAGTMTAAVGSLTQTGSISSFFGASGSITATGAVNISNTGGGYARVLIPLLEATDQSVTISSSSSGDAYITLDAMGSESERIGSLVMTTSGTGKAYIDGDGSVAIYGTRTASLSEGASGSQAAIETEEALSVGLGYTPADGDVYIQADSMLTLDLDAPTFTSNSGNVYLVGGDITFGRVNGGGTADDPMWALNSANNLIFELTDASGVLQFNEGFTNAGTGNLTLKGGIIQLGTSAHTHTNDIIIRPTGPLTVDFIHDNGALKAYGAVAGSSKDTLLTSAASSPAVTIQETSGKSGAQVIIEGGTDTEAAVGGSRSNGAYGLSVNFNGGANAGSSHKSIHLVNGESKLSSRGLITIDVPRNVEIDDGGIILSSTTDVTHLVDITAENIFSANTADGTGGGIVLSQGLIKLTVGKEIVFSTSGTGLSLIQAPHGIEIARADEGITLESSSSGAVYMSVSTSGDLDIGWTSKNDIGPIVITASSSGSVYMRTGRDQVQINGSADITLASSGTGSAYIEATGNAGSDKNITIGSEANSRTRAGAIMIKSVAGTGSAYFNAPNGSIDIVSGAVTLSNEANGVETLTYIDASGDVNIDSSAPITLQNKGAIYGGSGNRVVYITSGGETEISACTGLSLLYDLGGGGDPGAYGDVEIDATGDLSVTSSGQVRLAVASDSPSHESVMKLSTQGALAVTASSIDMTDYNTNGVRMDSAGNLTIDTGIGALSLSRLGTGGTNNRSSSIVSNGSIDITCGSLSVINGANGETGSGATPSSSTYIQAATSLDVAASGAILIENSGEATGTAMHPYVAFLEAGTDLTISDSSSLELKYSSTTATGAGDVGIFGAGAIDMASSGEIKLNDTTASVGEGSVVEIAGESVTLDSGSLNLSMHKGNVARIASAGGGINIDAHSGAVHLETSQTDGEVYIAPAPNGDITISRSGSLTMASAGGINDVFLSTSGTLSITTTGAATLTDAKLFASGAGGVTLTAGGTITSSGGYIEADTGSVTLVSDLNTTFEGTAQTIAESGSVIIASDQASVATGIGHINIGASTTFTASDKLRFFCGYFENNNISTSADLNGGTFSGVIDTPDANNIYDVAYDISSLPTEYGAPYTFYYDSLTPTDMITAEVDNTNILLTSTLVGSSQMSQDAALTQLARFRARFVERGAPFKEGLSPREKRRKRRLQGQ